MNTEIVDCQIENQPVAEPANHLPASADLVSPPIPARVAPQVTHRRLRGKVARLPLHARNLVNQALRDGVRYVDIIGLLAAHGFHGFKIYDIYTWTKRGYRLWLDQQERFEQSRPHSLRAAALLGSLRQDAASDLADLNESILSAQLNNLIETVDESNLKQLLADKPEDYFRLARAITAFADTRSRRQEVALERLKYELEIRKIQERHAKRVSPQQITPEIRARIDAAAKLF